MQWELEIWVENDRVCFVGMDLETNIFLLVRVYGFWGESNAEGIPPSLQTACYQAPVAPLSERLMLTQSSSAHLWLCITLC